MTRQQTPPVLAAGGRYVYLCLDHPVSTFLTSDEPEGWHICPKCQGRPLTLAWDPQATVFSIIAGLAWDVKPEVITTAPYGTFAPAPIPAAAVGKLRVVASLIRSRACAGRFEQSLPDALVIADGEWAMSLFGGETGPAPRH